MLISSGGGSFLCSKIGFGHQAKWKDQGLGPDGCQSPILHLIECSGSSTGDLAFIACRTFDMTKLAWRHLQEFVNRERIYTADPWPVTCSLMHCNLSVPYGLKKKCTTVQQKLGKWERINWQSYVYWVNIVNWQTTNTRTEHLYSSPKTTIEQCTGESSSICSILA